MNSITIIGVGLLGGSIGIDIQKKKLAQEVVGVVRRKESIDECKRIGAVTRATLDVGEGVKKSDMVIIATPISIMPKVAQEVKKYIKKECIVIDIASVKGNLVTKLESILGNNYLGTHPMAGSEKKGVSESREDLFNGAICIITPTKNTRPKFLKDVSGFWKGLGAKTIVLSPEEHDRLVSFTSHLPHLVAASLVNILTEQPKAADCIGPGFLDSTRIAKSPPELWREICEWNRDEILYSIDKFQNELSNLKTQVGNSDWGGFIKKMERAKMMRDKL